MRTLAELNQDIARLLAGLNDRTMRVYGRSRRQLFDELDRPHLRPLPAHDFALCERKEARANIDYHVEFAGHFYSVPHGLVGKRVHLRVTDATVEVFHDSRRVASHLRSVRRGHHTTHPEHMPKAHRQQLEWSPTMILDWAAKIGPQTAALAQVILVERPHPEQGYRSWLGLIRLARRYEAARVEAACARGLVAGARSYHSVRSMLENGLDRLPLATEIPAKPERRGHEYVRGPGYYN